MYKRQGYLLVGAEDERDVFRRYLEETYLTQDFTDFSRKELLENLLMKDETVSVRKLVEKYDVAKSSICLLYTSSGILYRYHNMN